MVLRIYSRTWIWSLNKKPVHTTCDTGFLFYSIGETYGLLVFSKPIDVG